MFELRWLEEELDIRTVGGEPAIRKTLQFRQVQHEYILSDLDNNTTKVEQWSEWEDVPTEEST